MTKRRLFEAVAVALTLFTLVVADTDPSAEQYCVTGCQTALSLNSFAGTPSIEDGYYIEECQNPIHVKSIYACSRRYCSASEVDAGIAYLNETCQEYGFISMLGYEIVSNLTDGNIQDLPTVSLGDLSIINTTTIPDQSLFDLGYRTIAVWYEQRDIHLIYSEAMFIFWGCVIAIGILHNAISHTRWRPATLRPAWSRIKAALVLSPTFRYHCDEPIGQAGSIPARLESLVIFVFVAINVVLCAVPYETFVGNLYYTETSVQLLRYIADRTGYLSYANLSIFWLFGIRNNILLWATGWQFATFNHFHRWVARVSTLEAIVHSVAYTVFSFREGGLEDYTESFQEQYWYTGVVAVIAMAFVIGFSIRWLRVRFYDFFLVAHIVLALVVLVNLFYHTSIFLGQYDGFLWPCVAIWGFDRAVRVTRIVFNLATCRRATAAVEYDSGADLVRIDVTDALSEYLKTSTGSYFYIYMPSQWRFWESHPFTIVHWKADLNSERTSLSSAVEDKELEINTEPASSERELQDRYVLMVRPHRGFTGRLAAKALATQHIIQRRMLLEGPYGAAPHLDADLARVLFIIGGSGISAGVAEIYRLLDQPHPPVIDLVWAARSPGLLASVVRRELHHALPRVSLRAYITGSDPAAKEREMPAAGLENVAAETGRPDVWRAIEEATAAARGPLGVVACGPSGMMNDVRVAVVELLGKGKDVRLSLESFLW